MTLIKRYANRKLYNTATSRYITLRGISELLEKGEDVRVVDNETGEDITAVTLSQILVDSGRGGRAPSGSVLNELLSRGGELYETLRRVGDDASEGIEELQRGVRRMMRPNPSARTRDWIAFGPPDFEKIVQRALERMTEVLDLPRRSDFEALRERLDEVSRRLDELHAAHETSHESGHAPSREAREMREARTRRAHATGASLRAPHRVRAEREHEEPPSPAPAPSPSPTPTPDPSPDPMPSPAAPEELSKAWQARTGSRG